MRNYRVYNCNSQEAWWVSKEKNAPATEKYKSETEWKVCQKIHTNRNGDEQVMLPELIQDSGLKLLPSGYQGSTRDGEEGNLRDVKMKYCK